MLVLSCVLAACSVADPDSIAGAIQEQRNRAGTASVTVPPAPDLTRTGRVGLRLATNSVGWERALNASPTRGAVILLVVPNSPSDRAGLKRGDVITQVGPSVISNDERAQVALRGKPSVPLKVTIDRGDEELVIDVIPGPPIEFDQDAYVAAALKEDPRDATNLLLRAQTVTDRQEAKRLVDRALEVQPDLVDALILRARLFWAESLEVTNEAVIRDDRRRANDDYQRALEIDPNSTSVLRSRSTGSLEVLEYDSAERDGLRAIGIDASFPSAYYAVAAGRLGNGRYREAAAPARDAVRLDPYDAHGYRLLALVFVGLERRDDASETVRLGLTVAADDNERAALEAVITE